MKEKEGTRIVTDDLACRLLSDMIKKEDGNTTTGLLYGVNCISPIVVPIPYINSKCDYDTWIGFDATSIILEKTVTVKVNKVEMRCNIVYEEQSLLPNWYSNRLLSQKQRPLLGNVLLVCPDKEWPKEIVVAPEWVTVPMQSDEETAHK